jgi:metal-responsive CopG/Arc/MetJ family transcriptional regulator
MECVKTAVSISKSLFEEAEAIARSMRVSRSRLFALALEDYLRRQKNRAVLQEINAAYGEAPEASERALRAKARRTHQRIVEGDW